MPGIALRKRDKQCDDVVVRDASAFRVGVIGAEDAPALQLPNRNRVGNDRIVFTVSAHGGRLTFNVTELAPVSWTTSDDWAVGAVDVRRTTRSQVPPVA